MKIDKCPACDVNTINKDVEEIYGKTHVLVNIQECPKCNEQYVSPEEGQRVYEIVHPHISEKMRRFFVSSVLFFRRLAW